jgi:hypothetical protein
MFCLSLVLFFFYFFFNKSARFIPKKEKGGAGR